MSATPASIDWVLVRLQELRGQHAEGEVHLAELRQREGEVHDTLLRLAGAIQVLEELVIASGAFASPPPTSEGASSTLA